MLHIILMLIFPTILHGWKLNNVDSGSTCGDPMWVYDSQTGYCYWHAQNAANFFEASMTCRQRGGNLPSLQNMYENNLVVSYAGCTANWINYVYTTPLSDQKTNTAENFKWFDNSGSTFSNWYTGIYDWDSNYCPTTGNTNMCYAQGSNYPCVILTQYPTNSNWTFGVVSCTVEYPFVCKKSAINIPQLTSTESLDSTTSVPATSRCRDGWSIYGNSCYMLSSAMNISNMDLFGAQMYCRYQFGADHADLLSVENPYENVFVYDELMGCELTCSSDCTPAWIGLVNTDSSRVNNIYGWSWTDNSPVSATVNYWNGGNPPSNAADNQCAVIGKYGFWTNVDCYDRRPFVCKMAASG